MGARVTMIANKESQYVHHKRDIISSETVN